MGQSSIIGVAFIIFVLATGIASIFSLSISSLNLLNNVVPNVLKNIEVTKNEEFQINNIELNQSRFEINITNAGHTSIKYNDFSKMDFYVIYNFNGTDYTKKIQMNNSDENITSWSVREVYVNQNRGDIINPINLIEGYGFWDPLETIEFEMVFKENYTKINYIIFCSPNGSSYYVSVEKSENYGESQITSEYTSVSINHGLYAAPKNIQISPKINMLGNSYWVSNVTDTTFTVYIDHSETFNFLFYWLATVD